MSGAATSLPDAADSAAQPPSGEISGARLRRMQISEFSAWLRTQTNKHQRPFQEEIVSPLIAPEDDQLADLRAAGLDAIVLNSRQSAGKRAAALLAACQPDTFVFLSPEQLANAETRETLQRARPGRGSTCVSIGTCH